MSPRARAQSRALIALHRRDLDLGDIVSVSMSDAGRAVDGLTLRDITRHARRSDVLAHVSVEMSSADQTRLRHLRHARGLDLLADAISAPDRHAPCAGWPFVPTTPRRPS